VNRYRSLMFVPGARPDLLEKAGRFQADVLCLDLEESVLPDDKARARELVRTAIQWLAGEQRAVHARLNSIGSGLTRDDVAAVVQPGLGAVLLAKADSPQDVRAVDVLLREFELAAGVQPGTVELIVAIESTRALLRCEEISRASTRIAALMLGGEDFAFDLGVQRSADGVELQYPRAVVATCARAAGLLAFDTPWAGIEDLLGLEADARRAKGLGFDGKYVIHPGQIDPVHRIFSPSEDEVAAARSVLEAWDEAQSKGLGAIQLNGRMIDRPIAERARRTIEQAGG
jgi:citrate lyase subunit beta/citryl-CoA lyase